MNDRQQKRFDFGDKHLGEIKSELAGYFGQEVREASLEEDRKEATDLWVGQYRVMARVRKFADKERYSDQFTLRHNPRIGHVTELQKVKAGLADYLIYAFANEEGTGLDSWKLIDLDALRLQLDCYYESIVPPERVNLGDDCSFYAYTISGFCASPPIVAASSADKKIGEGL